MSVRPAPSEHPLSLDELFAHGRGLRASIPRRAHGTLDLPERDPLALLEEQNASRMPDLVPIRMGRMMQSPFAFFRGSAAQMAHDLRGKPRTDLRVVACGDAHIGNFGFFASPDRRLVFDLNDFDEVNVAPWEWDLLRLCASIVLAGRDLSASENACAEAVSAAVYGYRTGLCVLYRTSALDRFYYRADAKHLEARASNKDEREMMRRAASKAKKRTSARYLHSIATDGEGFGLRIVDQPPILQHRGLATRDQVQRLIAEYRSTVEPDVALLLEQYSLADGAFRMVGVGSVGLRAHIVLMVSPGGDPLFLQVKEARPSVLVEYGGMPFGQAEMAFRPPTAGREGWRVVTGQRVMQATSDRFLGWISVDGADFYVRQFRDMKGSVDLESLTPGMLADYSRVCGAVLARAHAQSPAGSMIRGYLGRGGPFDQALVTWSRRYADQVEADHAALVAAVRAGRVAAEENV